MNSNWPLIIGLFSGVPAAIVAGYVAIQQLKIKADVSSNTDKIDFAKTEVSKDVELARLQARKDAQRVDLAFTQQQKIIDRQDKQLNRLEGRFDDLRRDMNVCIEERTKFKAMYNALEAQFKNTKEYQAARNILKGATLSEEANGKG